MSGSTIGKLQAALASATNEVTVAAASLNFDFALVKYEAPKEYQPLGTVLSLKRKHSAEHGKYHVTARRLSALFEDICPDTPNLITAYGERVSNISKLATDSVSKDYSESIFSAFTGVDATSIWAAVTSSQSSQRGAIHIHLLACILASMWDPPVATSIWWEIVEKRRQQIASQLESNIKVSFATASAAAQHEISRSQLADWDTSARAWIETANQVMEKKQDQLKIIIKNVALKINKTDNLYDEVMRTWHTALSVMESLVSGIPQEVQDGVALCALSAWHLYPDIHVFGPTSVQVQMNDSLVRLGGILTIGCTPAATTPANGVSWSLSLSHLRHYGYPIQKTAHLQDDPDSLTINEFRQVVLGCVFQIWGVAENQEFDIMDVLSKIYNAIAVGSLDTRLQKVMQFLEKASESYNTDPTLGSQLVALGRRRSSFIPSTKREDNAVIRARLLFGLSDITILMGRLRIANLHVAYLRRVCQRYLSPELCPIIRYDYHSPKDTSESVFNTSEEPSDDSMESSDDDDSKMVEDPGEGMPKTRLSDRASDYACFATAFESNGMSVQCGTTMMPQNRHTRWFSGLQKPNIIADEFITYHGTESELTVNYTSKPDFEQIMPASFIRNHNGCRIEYEFIFGDRTHGAIFIPRQTLMNDQIPQFRVENMDLKWAFEDARLCEHEAIHGTELIVPDSVSQALLLLYDTTKLLTSLPGRIIKTKILRKPLPVALWENHSALIDAAIMRSFQRNVSVASFFIAGLDVRPDEISSNVMGLSVGNSIFVHNRLLEDPITAVQRPCLRRILGNLGTPGCVIINSIDNPMVPRGVQSRWRDLVPVPFNGRPENAFGSVSMHFSLTDWKRFVDVQGDQGNQDAQFWKMEAVISIREGGKWIADVDTTCIFTSTKVYLLTPQAPCTHPKEQLPNIPMVSIESWDVLKDLPVGNVVVRAHGNWLGRLAITAFLAQCANEEHSNIRRITVCPPVVCWHCIDTSFSDNVYIY